MSVAVENMPAMSAACHANANATLARAGVLYPAGDYPEALQLTRHLKDW